MPRDEERALTDNESDTNYENPVNKRLSASEYVNNSIINDRDFQAAENSQLVNV